MSTLPSASQPVTTTSIPAIWALAGLVPWAEEGMRQIVRWPWPRARCQAWMTKSPAYSPWLPAFG